MTLPFREFKPTWYSGISCCQIVQELDGKRVIITGYMYPGASQKGIKEFVLLRQKDCPLEVWPTTLPKP